MVARWLRWFRRAPAAPRDWRLVVDGVELAVLRDPKFAEMFWTSLEIVPAGVPGDARLADDEFWWSDRWRLVDASTGLVASMAVASSAGLQRGSNRVVMRGLHVQGGSVER